MAFQRTPEARRKHGAATIAGQRRSKIAHGIPSAPLPLPPRATAEDESALRRAERESPDIGDPISWTEYAAKVRAGVNLEVRDIRRIERETLERERIPVAEVRAWCQARAAAVNRLLASVGSLPAPTPEQAAWLMAWDRRVRESLLSEIQ